MYVHVFRITARLNVERQSDYEKAGSDVVQGLSTRLMNALKCRTLSATLARILENACTIETLTTACANSESTCAI